MSQQSSSGATSPPPAAPMTMVRDRAPVAAPGEKAAPPRRQPGPPAPKGMPPRKPVWDAPYVCVGMPVLWHPDGSPHSYPRPAMVTHVGDAALELHVIEPDMGTMTHKTAVHHLTADQTPQAREDSGGWAHTADTLRLYDAVKKLAVWPEAAEWEARAAELEKAAAKAKGDGAA